MKSGKIRNLCVILAPLLSLYLIPSAVWSAANGRPHDPDYDPLAFDVIHMEKTAEGTRSMQRRICILPRGEDSSDSTLLIRAVNPAPHSSSMPRLSTISYPDWLILDEDPVPFVIKDWLPFHSQATGEERILVAGVTDRSVMVRVESPTSELEKREQLELYAVDSADTSSEMRPSLFMVAAGDLDNDGQEEMLIASAELREPRMLWCVQPEPLRVRWKLHAPSPIAHSGLFVTRSGGQPRIVFTTGNPDNGVKDSVFSDQYSYFVVLDGAGRILTKKVISCNYLQRSLLAPLNKTDKFFLAHSQFPSSPQDCDTVSGNMHHLSLINLHGVVERTAPLPGIPAEMWIDNRAPGGGPAVCVWMRDETLEVFDTSLALIESRRWKSEGRYLGRALIDGYGDSVIVFSSGLFTQDMSDRLLTFPTGAEYWEPLKVDGAGKVAEMIVGNAAEYYVGRIREKSALELVSVFYHRNQTYVLMLLSGLLVGLVVVNIYRHRAKSNLDLISRQKAELERTHEELKEAQAKLIAAEKYKQAQDIAGGFAHEIRNALFPADGVLTKLRRAVSKRGIDDEQRNRYYEHAQRAVQRAIDITRTISSYTKLDTETQGEGLSLRTVVDEVIEANRLRLEAGRIGVKREIDANAMVSGVRQQLEIVFNNLLLNSIDAVADRPDPSIVVRGANNGRLVNIDWSDNGVGIPPENLSRVFEPFFSTKPPDGTGLGLAVVKRIVDLHNGTIRVDSTPGERTTFHLQLPAKQERGNV
jgi:signal transduction histidine kinase